MAVFLNAAGNEIFRGTAATYDQVDYAGNLSDYTLVLNDDGSVTVIHPTFGTDTLFDIDGFWFMGEARWYSLDEALAIAGDVDGEVDSDGVIVGNNQDNILTGTDADDVFYGGRGDDVIDGGGGDYNQVDYDGARADYRITRNDDGTVSVSHAEWGTDTLSDIDGLWFGGEGEWYSIDAALDGEPDAPDGPSVNPWGVLRGTNANDVLEYSDGVTSLYGGLGNDRLVGEASRYSQADYDGRLSDYRITVEADGTVVIRHPVWGVDRLTDIDGLWFAEEASWYSLADILNDTPEEPGEPEEPETPEEPGPEGTGILIDGVITGSNAVDDLLIGTNANDSFAPGMGVDRIEGGRGNRDVINVDGDVIEWTFSTNAEGETVMSHATWGENTLDGVELIFFGRSGQTMRVADAVAATEGLGEFRLDADDVLNGTNGDDRMRGEADGTSFYGGTGDDIFIGRTDAFDQVNYDGARSEYDLTRNNDGTITIDHPVWGTDTLRNIDGLVFTGREPGADGQEVAPFEYVNVDDLFVETRVVIAEIEENFDLFG